MRLVIQRVHRAQVNLQSDDSLVNEIKAGILCLVGVDRNDTWADAEYCINKLLKARLWSEWNTSVVDNDYELLLVSQFTLLASLKKGNKPDFHAALSPDPAHEIFNKFVKTCKEKYKPEKVKTGMFGNYSRVSLENDGPVTIFIDSSSQNLNRTIKEKNGKDLN